MGGGATWDYAGSSLSAASRLAAIVVACGAGDVSINEGYNIGHANLPILATHNWDDPLVAAIRTQWSVDSILASNPNMHPMPRTIFWPSGGHNAWSRTFEKLSAGSYTGGDVTDTLGMNMYNWMLQFDRLQLALPVSWQSVSVEKRDEKIFINWVLATQQSVNVYKVERSNDVRNWKLLSTINATTDKQNVQYSYYDLSAPQGKLFYRILAVDFNGATNYSTVKMIDNENINNGISVYPNPFVNHLSISIPATNESTCTVRIADESGKIICNKQINSSTQSLIIEGSEQLPAGLYCVSVLSQGKQVFRQTVLKQ